MATKKKTRKKATRRRRPSARKKTILQSQCERYAQLLMEGDVLAIDPSSGSDSSQPGYALFSQGMLVEHGTIELGTRRDSGLANRLHLLKNFLEEEFEGVDLVAIERCPFRYANLAAARLQQVMGVVKSVWDVPAIEVSPVSWKKWIDRVEVLGIQYEKKDELDAVAIGVCVIGTARDFLIKEEE